MTQPITPFQSTSKAGSNTFLPRPQYHNLIIYSFESLEFVMIRVNYSCYSAPMVLPVTSQYRRSGMRVLPVTIRIVNS